MQAPLKKPEHWDIECSSCVNFCEIKPLKVCPKTWAYFALKLGWFKTNAGTNIGPQNDMYLSAPGKHSVTNFVHELVHT